MVKKIVALFFIIVTAASAVELHRFVEVVPANVDYNDEYVEEFSSKVYDLFQDAIASYNNKQTVTSELYKVKENTLPEKKYAKRTKRLNKEVAKDPFAYMKRRNLDKLIVFDFISRKVSSKMRRCSKECSFDVKVMWYVNYKNGSIDKNGKEKKKLKVERLSFLYNVQTGLFSQTTVAMIRAKVARFLRVR